MFLHLHVTKAVISEKQISMSVYYKNAKPSVDHAQIHCVHVRRSVNTERIAKAGDHFIWQLGPSSVLIMVAMSSARK
jgi:hypothetical protein